MTQLTVDDLTVQVAAGTTVLDAAQSLGIEIPTLCHHADLSPTGSCRMCIVEVAGQSRPQTACNLVCADGMKVFTETADLVSERRIILEMLLSSFHDAGYTPDDRQPTEFLRWVEKYGATPTEQIEPRHRVDTDPNPFVWVDLNKCILCTRCVRACQEIQGRFVWGVAERGDDTRVMCGNDTTMLDARCESCGACVAYCPTGALDNRMSMQLGQPDRIVRTTCGYCGVGCQFDLNIKQERVAAVTSTPAAPVNGMSLCVKGRYGYDFVHHQDRVLRPRVRKYLVEGTPPGDRPVDRGPWVDVEWDVAVHLVAKKFATVLRESGSRACGVLSSAKCTNEENYLMQKFSRQVLGTNNVDHCARLCHSSTVAGLAMAMGSGAMSNSMDDITQNAAAILIIGSNTTEQHPVFGAMLRQAALRRGTKIIVADPRRIDITEFAEMHLRQRPGTDVALVNGMMHLAIENEWHDNEFIKMRCEGFEEVRASVEKYTPSVVAEITGIAEDDVRAAAQILCTNCPMAVIWSMGITQHTTGVANVLSLANLQMLLGNMGVAGGGVNPLRGQNNVQGACDMGALPNVYPGYQRVDEAHSQRKFEEAWGWTSAPDGTRLLRLDALPGLTVTELIQAAGDGDVRSLYILGEDPAMTEPDSNHARECLTNAEFLVLQEILTSETAAYADVLLPGASFAEKDGSFTNTERRVQPIRQAIKPLGESRPDWQIISQVATELLEQLDRQPTGDWASWHYGSAADVLHEINALTPSYAGITPLRVDRGERLQWPVLDEQHHGTPILHVDRFARGLGKFHVVEHLPPAEVPDDEYPLLLTTGRVLYHWHGGELTRRSSGLASVCPEPMVEISREDAQRHDISHGDWIDVYSRRGQMRARAFLTARVAEGVVFGNFHFPGLGNVNNLTINRVDPVAKIPEYKVCAVQIGQASSV